MFGQSGKMTFMSLIALAILVLGGFMAFKYIGTNLEKRQIKKDVFNAIGDVRGHEFTSEELQGIIGGVLKKKGVEILEMNAFLDKSRQIIHYSFQYRIEADYFLFKRSEIVLVEDEIANYG
jgi:hypothetical protein